MDYTREYENYIRMLKVDLRKFIDDIIIDVHISRFERKVHGFKVLNR